MMRVSIALFVLLLSLPSISHAAEGALFLSPARGTYTLDDSFEVVVRADTDGQESNAAEADISFNPATLSVLGISTDGSVLSLWPTQPTYSNNAGTIRFSGTAAGSFNAHDANLITITFRAVGNVGGDVHFDSGALLLNDARATNIITGMRSALYSVEPRQSQPPPEYPAQVASSSTAETPEVKGAAIQVPTISGYDDRVSIGERIVLQGSAAPNSAISIFLQYEEEAPRESSVLSTSAGGFTYVASEPAQRGVYRAWAQVSGGDETYPSEKVVIVARSEGVAAAVESMGAMLLVALPYVLLLTVLGALLGYFYNRKRTAGSTAASS